MKPSETDDVDRTPWISVRISLPRHHRTLALRDTIEDAPRNLRWEAMGAMLDLWINTFTVAWADGDLSKWRPEDIEEMVAWRGKPGLFIEALKSIGFMDPGSESMRVTGWMKHQKRALRDRLRHYETTGRPLPSGRPAAPADDSEKIRQRTAAARKSRAS